MKGQHRDFFSLFHSLNGCNGQGWPRLNLGAWNSISVSRVGGRGLRARDIFHCLLVHKQGAAGTGTDSAIWMSASPAAAQPAVHLPLCFQVYFFVHQPYSFYSLPVYTLQSYVKEIKYIKDYKKAGKILKLVFKNIKHNLACAEHCSKGCICSDSLTLVTELKSAPWCPFTDEKLPQRKKPSIHLLSQRQQKTETKTEHVTSGFQIQSLNSYSSTTFLVWFVNMLPKAPP